MSWLCDAQFFGRGRAHQGRIVPSELGHRVGPFLQPAAIGEAAVVDLRVGAENDFKLAVDDLCLGDDECIALPLTFLAWVDLFSPIGD